MMNELKFEKGLEVVRISLSSQVQRVYILTPHSG